MKFCATESTEGAKSIFCEVVDNPDAVKVPSAKVVAVVASVDTVLLSIRNTLEPVWNVVDGTLKMATKLPPSSVVGLESFWPDCTALSILVKVPLIE